MTSKIICQVLLILLFNNKASAQMSCRVYSDTLYYSEIVIFADDNYPFSFHFVGKEKPVFEKSFYDRKDLMKFIYTSNVYAANLSAYPYAWMTCFLGRDVPYKKSGNQIWEDIDLAIYNNRTQICVKLDKGNAIIYTTKLIGKFWEIIDINCQDRFVNSKEFPLKNWEISINKAVIPYSIDQYIKIK